MSASDTGPLGANNLKAAFKAFKKRLKLTQLDQDSKIGVGPLSGGSKGSVCAITPPTEFPAEVWDELVKQGKLKKASRGMYELAATD